MTWAMPLLTLLLPVAEIPASKMLALKYIPLALFVIVLTALLIKAIRVWQEIHDIEEPATPSEVLASLEEAHAAGELSSAEIARVREQLANPEPNPFAHDHGKPPTSALRIKPQAGPASAPDDADGISPPNWDRS
jgi:hypothetical protein